jgi:steroid delta-isomerase-like uncharacterized protein
MATTLPSPAEANAHAHGLAQRYFDAWNRRDPDAIMATFAPGGTYSDPSSGILSGPAIGAYAAGLFAAFPDLSFDLHDVAVTELGTVTAEWIMHGTNGGPFLGLPPSGKTVHLPGADFITVGDDGIRSVRGYFDQRAFVEQLGLLVEVKPRALGPFTFGSAVSVMRDGQTTPGAFSVTALTARSDEEVARISEVSRQVLMELVQTPGFLSAVTSVTGRRMMTVSAWESSADSRRVMRTGTHRTAMDLFFGPDLAAGGITSVWQAERINAMWVRCTACERMVNADRANGVCECGAELPEPPPFF